MEKTLPDLPLAVIGEEAAALHGSKHCRQNTAAASSMETLTPKDEETPTPPTLPRERSCAMGSSASEKGEENKAWTGPRRSSGGSLSLARCEERRRAPRAAVASLVAGDDHVLRAPHSTSDFALIVAYVVIL